MTMKNRRTTLAVALAGTTALVAGGAGAAEILVTQNIATSVTWTANNTYNLQQQINVLPGATLTIEPGTVIASTTNLGGSLAVVRGAKIIAAGTREKPIIFTSTADVATWTDGNPKTGTYRQACNEWGNLTILGRAFISNSKVPGNSKTFSASNFSPMEGLVPAFVNDPNTIYGGGDDDDDSGVLRFVSFRYGGKVIGLGNELNGLSLGGIGRQTELEYIEIMNNVDDGIEIWGGTCNLKHFAIWNIGDDSLDVDQGWRGKAQFGLIVQGYSVGAGQGSGVGDNALEMDGAEGSDAQPVTTASLYNLTVIGQPISGDHGSAWRDNARVQIRNSIFMDLGERLVALDNVDGDGGEGYGFNGTLSWANTWTTDWNVYSTVNAPKNPAQYYTAQTDGKLAEIKDSVMFRNNFATAYTIANQVGVFDAANHNVNAGNDVSRLPVAALTRAAPITVFGSLVMVPVTFLDPRAAADAVTSVGAAPDDGFFTPAQFRGAFSATENWLCGWTASDAYGLSARVGCVVDPTPCPGDFNGNGTVDAADLSTLLAGWGTAAGDLNGDGTTDAADLSILLGAWGDC